jgi:hypothetical protein
VDTEKMKRKENRDNAREEVTKRRVSKAPHERGDASAMPLPSFAS